MSDTTQIHFSSRSIFDFRIIFLYFLFCIQQMLQNLVKIRRYLWNWLTLLLLGELVVLKTIKAYKVVEIKNKEINEDYLKWMTRYSEITQMFSKLWPRLKENPFSRRKCSINSIGTHISMGFKSRVNVCKSFASFSVLLHF